MESTKTGRFTSKKPNLMQVKKGLVESYEKELKLLVVDFTKEHGMRITELA